MDGDINFIWIVSVDGDTVPPPPKATTDVYKICPTSFTSGALEYSMAISSATGMEINDIGIERINLDVFDLFKVDVVVYGSPIVSAVSAFVYSASHSCIHG
ncbi:hypothetical protein ES703_52389 [subsurface metagenome]